MVGGPATAKARELLYLSARLGASAALELGLVNAVLPDNELLPHVLQTARTVAAGPRVALSLMKANLALALSAELEDAMHAEVAHHVMSKGTADHAEAAAAFVERRPPRFSGR